MPIYIDGIRKDLAGSVAAADIVGVLGISGGGTGAANAAVARTNLGIRAASLAASLGGIVGIPGFTRAYRIPLTGGSGGSDGYQLQLLIGESSGSPDVDFHVGGNSQSFPSGEDVGGDFKFAKADGSDVPFYVERVTGAAPNRVATIWVALPGGTSRDVIFLLSDNSGGIANQSDSAAVFPAFFDSFPGSALDTGKWTAVDSTGVTVGGGSMRHTSSSGLVRSNAAFSTPGIVLEVLWNGANRNLNGHIVIGFGNATFLTTDAIGYLWHPGQDFVRNAGSWIGVGTTLADNTEIVSRMTLTRTGIFNFVAVRHENYQAGSLLRSATYGNAVASENIFLGNRFDGGFGGQALDLSWRWVRVRQQGTAPRIGTVREV